jgi:hypothetical protein
MTFRLTRDCRGEWVQCFNRMAVGKSTPVDDKKMLAYWELLETLPFEAVTEAAEELKREPGPFLVDPGTWFRRASHIAARMLEHAATAQVQDVLEAVYHRAGKQTGAIESTAHAFTCSSCRDTGWCVEDHPDRQPSAQRCKCFERNPVLVAERARHEARRATKKRG